MCSQTIIDKKLLKTELLRSFHCTTDTKALPLMVIYFQCLLPDLVISLQQHFTSTECLYVNSIKMNISKSQVAFSYFLQRHGTFPGATAVSL